MVWPSLRRDNIRAIGTRVPLITGIPLNMAGSELMYFISQMIIAGLCKNAMALIYPLVNLLIDLLGGAPPRTSLLCIRGSTSAVTGIISQRFNR